MSTLTKNDCGVVTILPLGVDCSVINASTPLINDGRIYLNITGGSSPYSISWSNGQKTQTIKNLYSGPYTGTVVDYYGDYTATTVCTVGSNQIFVDYFVDCNNQNNLYLTGFTGVAVEGQVYKMTSNSDCYTYSGKVLSSAYTLTNDTILEGPFETCLECDPPFTPPYYPEMLCLFTENPYTRYQFEFYGFVNNKPAYTGTSSNSSSYRIEWFTGDTYSYWLVQGLTQLKNTSDTYNPLGGWKKEGTTQNWLAVSGSCPTIQELTITTTVNDETCEGNCDGSVTVIAAGGTGGYSYSLDGVNYTPQPTFKKMCPQTNTPIYVKDSSGNTKFSSFTIKPGIKRIQYTVSLKTKQYYTTQNWGVQTVKRMDYEVVVNPPLPEGLTIKTPLSITLSSDSYAPGKTNINFVTNLYSGGSEVVYSSSGLTTSGTTKRTETNCTSYSYTSNTYSVQYNDIVLTKDLTVSGSVISTITMSAKTDTVSGCDCVNITATNTGYNWIPEVSYIDCSNTLKKFALAPESSKTVCGCKGKVTGITATISYGFYSDACKCLTNGTSRASVNFNGTQMSGCATLIEQTPQSNQFSSTLYQITSSNNTQQ